MKAKYKAALEKKIEEFLVENCEELSEEHGIYCNKELVDQMTSAAELIMDSSIAGQQFAYREKAAV